MKTLHLTNAWHASSGGIGTFYRALLAAANREGHFMRLVVPGDATNIEEAGKFGRIYTIEAPRALLNHSYRMILPHRFLFPNTALQRIINDEKPDLIEISEKYTMNYLAGLLRTARLPGVNVKPVLVGLSCERMDESVSAYVTAGRLGQHFCRFYMKWLYFPMFDHHITVSDHTLTELVAASRGHRVRRGVWVMPMGVDCEQFTASKRNARDRAALLRRIGGHENTTILLYAGRLAPEKNVWLLIETMKRLDSQSHRLVVAGTGILLDEIRRQCEQHRLPVSFLGHVGHPENLSGLYANCDIFLHPNAREPFGIAPLEAMSSGLALVAPMSGGLTSYACENNAWLTEPSPDAFAAAVRAIGADPAATAAKLAQARRTAEDFRWSDVTSRFLALYRDLNALTRGDRFRPNIPVRTWSSAGDLWGRELAKQRLTCPSYPGYEPPRT